MKPIFEKHGNELRFLASGKYAEIIQNVATGYLVVSTTGGSMPVNHVPFALVKDMDKQK